MSQTEWIFFIDRTIREYGGVTIPQVCAEFEVCSRQAKRDIEYMRDRLDAPIVWSWSDRRYEYSQAWKALQCADERSVFAISFLRSILLQFHYIQRVIRPTRLINYSGKWYCVAHDSLTDVLRTFAVSRIQCDDAINPSDLVKSTFLKKTIDEKEVEYYVSASYGIFKGKSIGTATLRFYGGAARAVREQVWHKNQTMQDVELPDGRKALDLTLRVNGCP